MTRLFVREELVAEGDAALDQAAQLVDAGGVLGHPASTVYGLGGRPTREVDEEIARLKGRAEDRPLIRVAATTMGLEAGCPGLRWTPEARALAEAFWPGPLTLVVDAASDARGIGVRVDSHGVLRDVLERAGGVITSTSLNQTGEPPTHSAAEARTRFAAFEPSGASLAFLDAGDLSGAPPSTVVRAGSEGVRLLREGEISSGEIFDILEAAT